ncbi:hypothetical protein QE152_g14029 [Popillia japonica]|uniref:Uncharacterized protein n=1 Tax=Popillia japonica TaxID=7064 RepID=A0AAW1LAQ5_POPJA
MKGMKLLTPYAIPDKEKKAVAKELFPYPISETGNYRKTVKTVERFTLPELKEAINNMKSGNTTANIGFGTLVMYSSEDTAGLRNFETTCLPLAKTPE